MTGLRRSVIAAMLGPLLCLACSGGPAEEPAESRRTPLLIVGLDGLEWRVMLPMMREGRLPVMSGLMREGVYGRLQTLNPTRSPVIWTTVATGKTPDKHGIFGLRTTGDDGRERPYDRTDRKTKAVWNILSDFGLRVHCVGWWMTDPAEAISGIMVAHMNVFFGFDDLGVGRMVHPMERRGRRRAVHPPEFFPTIDAIAAEMSEAYEERAGEIFGASFEPPHPPLPQRLWDGIRWAITLDGIHLQAALTILEKPEPFDVMMVYLRGTDALGHKFWRYTYPAGYAHPPGPSDASRYGSVIPSYYEFADAAVGSLIRAVGRDAVVMVLSDHGMVSTNPGTDFEAEEHHWGLLSGGHDGVVPGVLIAAGPGIRRLDVDMAALTYERLPLIGSVLDVTPTLLAMTGVPIGEDMDGRPLNIFEPGRLNEHPLEFVASHDLLGSPLHSESGEPLSAEEIQDRIEELRSLGYIQ